jgi:hypothetical protein
VIYVIGERRTGIVKIGTNVNPFARLKELQAGNPRPLDVLVTLPGDRRDEAALHRAFADLCVGGEWFDFGEDDAVLAVVKAASERAPADRRPAAHSGTRARRASLDPIAAERTLAHVLATFANHGNPATLTTAILLDALNNGPDGEWWQSLPTPKTGAMRLADDLRACAASRSREFERGSCKVPLHDAAGTYVNGYYLRGLRAIIEDRSEVQQVG